MEFDDKLLEQIRKQNQKDLGEVFKESLDMKSKMFKTSDFIEWLESVSIEYINIKDLEMYVFQYSNQI